MKLTDIATLIGGVDAQARHYFSMSTADAYTYWEETQQLPLVSDDKHDEGWRFYVHRFTKDEADTVAAALYAALDTDPRVTVIHTTDYETDSGYLHHIFQCEGY